MALEHKFGQVVSASSSEGGYAVPIKSVSLDGVDQVIAGQRQKVTLFMGADQYGLEARLGIGIIIPPGANRNPSLWSLLGSSERNLLHAHRAYYLFEEAAKYINEWPNALDTKLTSLCWRVAEELENDERIYYQSLANLYMAAGGTRDLARLVKDKRLHILTLMSRITLLQQRAVPVNFDEINAHAEVDVPEDELALGKWGIDHRRELLKKLAAENVELESTLRAGRVEVDDVGIRTDLRKTRGKEYLSLVR